jgi:hypothetical protein
MSTDKTHEQYVASMLEKFDAFVEGALKDWPQPDRPLSSADFSVARYELLKMMNERRESASNSTASQSGAIKDDIDSDANQYLPVTPAPWP